MTAQAPTVPERLAKLAGLRCTYRACRERPIRRLTRSDGTSPWWGCAAHWSAMYDALHNGLSGATTGTGWVEVIDLDKTHNDDQEMTD